MIIDDARRIRWMNIVKPNIKLCSHSKYRCRKFMIRLLSSGLYTATPALYRLFYTPSNHQSSQQPIFSTYPMENSVNWPKLVFNWTNFIQLSSTATKNKADGKKKKQNLLLTKRTSQHIRWPPYLSWAIPMLTRDGRSTVRPQCHQRMQYLSIHQINWGGS